MNPEKSPVLKDLGVEVSKGYLKARALELLRQVETKGSAFDFTARGLVVQPYREEGLGRLRGTLWA